MTRKDELKSLLPSSFGDWHVDSDKYFDPESLYDYIDGGAELYISYGFKDVISRRYINSSGQQITVEIFDMIEAENAYGVFTQQREDESTDILQECQVIIGSIIFWRSKYFISLMNHKETSEVKEAMFTLANSISSIIHETGSKPELINMLPQLNLVPETIRFFKHYIWLNSYNFISSENIFSINSDNKAVLAKYNLSDPKPVVLLVEYSKAQQAQTVWNDLSKTYEFQSSKHKILKKDKKENIFYGMALSNQFLTAVFQASNMGDVEKLLNN